MYTQDVGPFMVRVAPSGFATDPQTGAEDPSSLWYSVEVSEGADPPFIRFYDRQIQVEGEEFDPHIIPMMLEPLSAVIHEDLDEEEWVKEMVAEHGMLPHEAWAVLPELKSRAPLFARFAYEEPEGRKGWSPRGPAMGAGKSRERTVVEGDRFRAHISANRKLADINDKKLKGVLTLMSAEELAELRDLAQEAIDFMEKD
jgi:hypothetical protein